MKFNISANLRFLLLPLTLAITAAGAHAALCDTFGPSQGPRVSYQCADSRADTDGSIGSRTVIHPDQIGFGLAVAESLAASGGITAGFATAWASATPGVLRGLTFGEGLGPPIDGVFVSSGQGEANASFVEYGYLKGAPGVPVGTPVKVHMVFNIEGSFNNFNEAVARFYVLRNGPSLVVNSSMTAWAPRPNGEREPIPASHLPTISS